MYFQNKNARIAMLATVGIGALAMSSNAQAQTITPVVDVCTGLSLDPSLVTDIVGETVQPVEDLETVLNGLVLSPLLVGLGLPVLNSDLATTLDTIANGNQLSLTVLDTDGNIVTSSDACNVTADGFTLDQEAGISIGGNAITGLGADGLGASAGELDAIAFGNSASTSAGATGAIAIGANASVSEVDGVALGNGASVTFANSVAIGAGSVTSRGAVAGYSSPGLTGTFDSVGEVSVGAPGAERQITNLAPGTAATDAATVGQVQGALDAVDALADVAVQYDDGTYATVTLQGASGTTVTNVADGALNGTSTDAVNGSQLFATNQNVQVNADAITALDGRVTVNEGDIANLDGRVTVNETDIANLDGRVTVNEGDIAALDGRVTVNEGDIANLDGRVTVNEGDIANLDGRVTTNETDIANLDGRVTTNETDIANLDGRVTTNETDIANLDGRVTVNEGDIANLDGRVTTNETDIANIDNRVTVNEGDIANLDGRVTVNETDIANLDGRVTVNEGDIANLDGRVTVNEGDIANIDGRVTVNETDIANIDSRVTVNEGDIVAIDGRVTTNETAITNLQTQVANVPLGYVDDVDGTTPSSSPTQTVAMIGAAAGPVTLTNVASGALSATSSDAVNGSQLHATNMQVDQNTTNIANNAADITTNASNIATNATNIANNTANISQNTSDIEIIQNNLAGSTVVAVQYSDASNPRYSNGGVVSQDVTLVGLDPNATVGLHNVADAVDAFDAVNLRQMQSGIDAALATANAYTDMRFAEIAFDLDDVRRASYAGTAGALAVSGLPQVIESEGQMIAGAIGHYRGETAFAIGYSASSSDGRAVFKFNGTVDTHGYAGISTGAGFAF
ncbi:YadA family autotransporter adhesin [Croceicoccus gelatinilyticus]|uniref:YadA family autotransporter adhesin n=1 Tax=Croceicoccus gelatinilyticus TaxID=2835536 RepID=UPI001BCDAFBF|nr:YadA-like family protein [Croceicoccus gelatinilyticus]MBS7669959.1 YadA-like family protein [Croceicoccus gelatinilyticus]